MKLNVEQQITLDQFKPRDYQVELFDAVFNRGIKRIILTWARRGGKDLACFNLAVRWALSHRCTVFYAGETYAAIRQIIWENKTIDGIPFLDFIPASLITKKNETRMRLELVNGSAIQFIGADSHKTSFRGANPDLVILTEYGYYDDGSVLDTVGPILAANHGVLIINSTPNGKNFYWRDRELAKQLPDWWISTKTVHDMKHIDPAFLEAEKQRMSVEKYRQEYECDFNRGVDGAIFGRELQTMEKQGRITTVAWEPGLLVHTVWDLGLSKGNETVILFFQVVGDGTIIRIIDCYCASEIGLDRYAAVIQEKGTMYRYGLHLAPHDIMVREYSDATTRFQKAADLGIEFTVLNQTLLVDQIEGALTHINKVWIDKEKCRRLLDGLENYYREWDEQKGVYKPKPVHNWASNWASAFMGIFLGLPKITIGKSGEYFDRIRNEALYGSNAHLPRIFQQGIKNIQNNNY